MCLHVAHKEGPLLLHCVTVQSLPGRQQSVKSGNVNTLIFLSPDTGWDTFDSAAADQLKPIYAEPEVYLQLVVTFCRYR